MASVIVTPYVPLALTTMLFVVSCVVHNHDVALPPSSVSITLPPAHIVADGVAVMWHVGSSFIVTLVLALSVHPFTVVTVRVYVPASLTPTLVSTGLG